MTFTMALSMHCDFLTQQFIQKKKKHLMSGIELKYLIDERDQRQWPGWFKLAGYLQ